MEPQQQGKGMTSSSQSGMLQDVQYSSVLQIRLDTTRIIEHIQTYLTGKVFMVSYDEEGKANFKEEVLSDPKANKEGIHWILNYVQSIVNPATVQGNFIKEEHYEFYIADVRSSLILNLMRNLLVWKIKDVDYEPIIDFIMALVTPFMSRLLANKERESYGGMRVLETSTLEQRDKGFSLNPFRK